MTQTALARVTSAHAKLEERRKLTDDALKDLYAAIAAAAQAGAKQRDIVEITGLSRERVRQICRDAGVKPA